MAWNDPDWGKKNSGGPPDLDELWRRFNQRLNTLFGGKGGSGGPTGGSPMSGGKLAAGLGLIPMLVYWSGWAADFTSSMTGQRGVVLRFGKFVETTATGAALASAVADRKCRSGQPASRCAPSKSATATTSRARC